MNTKLPYRHLFTIGIREAFVYQADFYMKLLSSIVLVIAQYFLWRAIFYNQTHIGNFSLQEIVTYMALVWITQGFSDTVWMARNLQNKILSGAIAHELLYPLNYPVYTLVLIYTIGLLTT
ncbi:MAG TPA: ABC-2 family transporter protein [Anaerolineae bacterium]|nr:ABC-2 family transporter protein [Anaerolineae bacterium]HQH38670.1 ABC-2 family transporter protein [Anaerolineae bacterium]